MNKIYKVLWSGGRRWYMVVSEPIKRSDTHKGSGGSVSLSALLCTAVIIGTTFVITSSVGAVDNDAVTGSSVTIGSSAPAKAPKNENDAGALHYFSVNSSFQDAGSNHENDGAEVADAMAVGPKAKADGIARYCFRCPGA